MAKHIGETSYKETAFGIIPRSKLIPLEIEGIKKAWDFVLKKNTKKKLPVTSNFIKTIHKVGFGWIVPNFGGKFRNIDVTVSKHIPPKFYLIPQEMDAFTKDLQIRTKHLPKIDNEKFLDELIGLLAWSHHQFLWIHPFQDYNGRIGRLLINLILLNLNLPPIELKIETMTSRKNYINALQSADNQDYKKLEKIFKSAIDEMAGELDVKK
jgi:cell filamentation protein